MMRIALAIIISLSTQLSWASPGDQLKYLPIQEAGRIKPFHTFSQEMLNLVYGKPKYEGRDAHEIILTWMLAPESWQDKKIFEIKNHQVLKSLGLPTTQRHFSGNEVFGNEKFNLLRQELQNKRQTQEKLNPYFQDLQRLENQFFVFSEIASGRLLRLIPPAPDASQDSWISVAEFNPEQQPAFMELTKSFVAYVGAIGSGKKDVTQEAKDLDEKVLAFESLAQKSNPALYPSLTRIKAEVHYNDFHPFRMAYIMYLVASLLMLLVWVMNKEGLMKPAWVFVVLGFLLHTYGFALRVYLMERAPVTNMYETVVWVSWGTVLFAAILEKFYRFKITLFAGALVGLFSLVVADFAPAVLDPSLQPLEPVLRSNYWLVVHVMTITISYAAFFLAFGLGDLGLYYYLKGETQNKEKIKMIVTSIYRSTQIGVLFLAPGIILGGIWADYSWGRFWGWDPKETWALIALLGYLAILHARIAGLLKDFGMVVTSVFAFSLVIMAWYGVNYVLGAGLHSYGFGAGGLEYVSAFVILHFLYGIYVIIIRQGRLKSSK